MLFVLLVVSLAVLRVLDKELYRHALKIAQRSVLFPVCTFGGGTGLFLLLNLFTDRRNWEMISWFHCCVFFGLPLALFCVWKSLEDSD